MATTSETLMRGIHGSSHSHNNVYISFHMAELTLLGYAFSQKHLSKVGLGIL